MVKPILTPTEYYALCDILEWCWTSVLQEPELCLKDINYSSKTKIVKHERTEAGIHTEYEPTGVDPIKTGECGLGLAEAFENTLEEPNAENIHTMITNLIYKLNCNSTLSNGFGNSWETLAPLVDREECNRLNDIGDITRDTTIQTLEEYIIEDIGQKNKLAKLQEYFGGVDSDGMIQVGENLWIDGNNSDILP